MTTPFTVGLVTMRSGLEPARNLDAAVKLIEEAKAGGADYVQTPEMTNIVANKRELMLAATVPEEDDKSLAAFRTLARKLGIHLHIGSLAVRISPDRAANRSFLIDPQGEIVARYDKIHMFDVDLAGGESYRESRSYRPGAISHAAPGAGRSRRVVPGEPGGLHQADRRGALAFAPARARDREHRVHVRGGAGRPP
jgi:predicted amidohydrolase